MSSLFNSPSICFWRRTNSDIVKKLQCTTAHLVFDRALSLVFRRCCYFNHYFPVILDCCCSVYRYRCKQIWWWSVAKQRKGILPHSWQQLKPSRRRYVQAYTGCAVRTTYRQPTPTTKPLHNNPLPRPKNLRQLCYIFVPYFNTAFL